MSGWVIKRRPGGIPCWPDEWDTLAEFDTWVGGYDYSDAAPEFDEAAMATVSHTPLTVDQREAVRPATPQEIQAAEKADLARAAAIQGVRDRAQALELERLRQGSRWWYQR